MPSSNTPTLFLINPMVCLYINSSVGYEPRKTAALPPHDSECPSVNEVVYMFSASFIACSFCVSIFEHVVSISLIILILNTVLATALGTDRPGFLRKISPTSKTLVTTVTLYVGTHALPSAIVILLRGPKPVKCESSFFASARSVVTEQ